MRKLLITIGLLISVGLSCVFADSIIKTKIPNLETSVLYSLKYRDTNIAFASGFMSIWYIGVKAGYIPDTSKVVGSLSFDLKDLEKIGIGVKYLWPDSIKASVETWGAYDVKCVIEQNRVDYGVGISIILIEKQ